MGHRVLKRVPLDFKWPLDKVWKGYVNPFPGPRACKECDQTGYNPETKQIADCFYDHDGFGNSWTYDYGFAPDGSPASRPPWRILGESRSWCDAITQDEVDALVAHGRLINFTHDIVPGEGWQPKVWETKGYWCPKCHEAVPQLSSEHHSDVCMCTGDETIMDLLDGDDIRLHTPTAEEVNLWDSLGGMGGHDAINRWILIETRAKRFGVWGHCSQCRGNGELKHPRKKKKQYRKWSEFEPPYGSGYQLWETCSEGSPISLVFRTAEELAEWCADNATIFGSEKTSRDTWFHMFVGEESLEAGSMLIREPGFIGAAINAP